MAATPQSSIERSATVLYVVTQDAVLVQAKQHQGGEVYDAFGISSQLDDLDGAASLFQQLVGSSSLVPDISSYLLHLQKPGEAVNLLVTAVCYRLVERLDVSEDTRWITTDQIDTEPRLRSDDKLLLKALVSHKKIKMEIWERQMGRWIDAEIIRYTEHSYED